MWTFYVQKLEDNTIEVFQIEPSKTFGEFRRIVAARINQNANDLLLAIEQEYDCSYNSTKISEIRSIHNYDTFLLIYHVGGGNKKVYTTNK